MNRELCKEIQEAFDNSNYLNVSFLVRVHVDDFMSGSFFVSGQLAEAELSNKDKELLPATAIRLKEIAREVISAVSDRLPDKIRYLLSRLVRETADELKELLDKYNVQEERAREEQALVRKYADDLLQDFVPYHERT